MATKSVHHNSRSLQALRRSLQWRCSAARERKKERGRLKTGKSTPVKSQVTCKVKRATSRQEPRKCARTAVGRSVNVCISESGTDRASGAAEQETLLPLGWGVGGRRAAGPRGRGAGVREDGCPTGRGGVSEALTEPCSRSRRQRHVCASVSWPPGSEESSYCRGHAGAQARRSLPKKLASPLFELGFPFAFFMIGASLVAQMIKNPPANAGDPGLIPGSGRPRIRAWQPTPVSLPGESHGQRSPLGYSPQGHRVRHDWATNPHFPLSFIRFIPRCSNIFMYMFSWWMFTSPLLS